MSFDFRSSALAQPRVFTTFAGVVAVCADGFAKPDYMRS